MAKKKTTVKKTSKKAVKAKQVKKKVPAESKAVKKAIKKTAVGQKTVSKSKSAKKVSSKNKAFSIVGIGASAGGLEAIEGFFANTPSDCNVAFVIIQHLSPDYKSIMGSLLEKYTKMKVMVIQDGMKIQPNCIYLNSPTKEVDILNGNLHLTEPDTTRAMRLPIDHFFRSLAADQGEKAVCIVLSGTGTDGTLGLKAIKGAGGMAMVQAEEQARYNNMPRSSIDTGLVDYILPVEKMHTELLKYVRHPYIEAPDELSTADEKFESSLKKIFIQIRAVTGHDFSHYKLNTIRRRIERRMAVHQICSIADYVRYLQQNNLEVEMLFKDMLITVTNFFRDPKAFKVLEEKVIPGLLENRLPDSAIRVWVSGCATGEEAYSIAILLVEAMQKSKKHINVQIFATDIDQDAIEYARQGLYPEAIAADVSMERLSRFFVKEDGTYRIKKHIREMVVFAVQNLIKDAPFSKLDLVSCRNVLIYMDSVLQKKILPLFHYTLNPGGFMFLGTSETIGDFADNFSVIDTKWKIYRRKTATAGTFQEHTALPFYETRPGFEKTDGKMPHVDAIVRQLAERVILQDYGSPCVFVNDKFDIVYFHGKTDKFLVQPSGEPSFDILKLAREEFRFKLNTMLHKAIKQRKTVVSEGLKIPNDGNFLTFDLTVKPLAEPTVEGGLAMVIFESKVSGSLPEAKNKEKEILPGEIDPRMISLEQELHSTKEYLHTTIEELETSNEELKSANEELQSTNEELQSTNEELETSREELQSTNEELETVNAELQNKVSELSGANNDLNNLLGSTQIATIFLDNDLCIKRFTPAMKNFFSLIGSDTGRPISDIVHQLKYEGLFEDVKQVLNNLGSVEKELQSKDGKWYFMKILPYRTLENSIDGVVITFFDITFQKQTQLSAENARAINQGILDTVREPLVILDGKMKVISTNQAFYDTFRVSPEETEGKSFYSIGNGQWGIAELKNLLEEILPECSEFKDFKVTHDFPKIGKKTMLLNARQIYRESVGTKTILLAIEEVDSSS